MSARIRVSFPALTLALLAGPVCAASAPPAQWQAIAAQTGNTVELDKSRISRLKNGQMAAWTRLTLDHPVLDFENQVRYTTVQALNYYDCAQGSFATQRRVFLLDGREIKAEKVDNPRQIPAPAESIDARLLDEVCKPRTAGEMQQTAVRAAAAATHAELRARPMHAEMVSVADSAPPRSLKVADTSAAAGKPRLIDVPQIDKSKAEDPFKAAPPAAPTTPVANKPIVPPAPVAVPAPAARPPAPKASDLPRAAELSRQQRELMLATSGPRRVAPKKKEPEVTAPPPPDFSRVTWGYAGLGAPENWEKLRPNYALCGKGKRQSPIDIRGGIRVDLEPIRFDYRQTEFRIVDNGHTIQVDVGEGSGITIMGRHYPLSHLHFHRPAEERINGKAYDMSMHLVHKDYDGSTAVIAVLMERGIEHPVIQTLWNHLPLEVGMEVMPPNVSIDLNKLLPEQRDYFTYMGSLTTPPCTEDVLWMVFKQPIPVSQEQIGIFARLYPYNARPVQPSNNRLIKGSR